MPVIPSNVYTLNIAQNPGLQNGLSGYTALANASISVSNFGSGGTLYGNPGLFVITPGTVSGEGVITPASPVQNTNNHTFSVYIQGITQGNLNVSAVINPGGIIAGSTPVNLKASNNWQRVVISNVPVTSGQSLSLIISTTSAESIQFWISNVQIESSPSAHPYCDGGQTGCYWLTTPGGISYQPYQFELTGSASNINVPGLVHVLIPGAASNLPVSSSFNKNTSAYVTSVFVKQPPGLMTDFSICNLSDPDPAQTYVSWNNSGLSVPVSGYARSWSAFLPVQDYFVSNNQQLYSRAAYMAVGWQFSNVPNNASVLLSNVQTEILPFSTGFSVPSPSSYVLPRAIQSVIKPDRLNFCTNPSFEVSLAGWSSVGGGTLSQDTSVSAGNIVSIDDIQRTSGITSMKVGVSINGDGAKITLSNLIAGDQYIVSAYVQAGPNISDIIMTVGSSTTSVLHGNSGTGYGNAGYGSGYYGGNPSSSGNSFYGSGNYGSGLYGISSSVSTLPTGQWYRIYTTFVPADITATLSITANPVGASNFWVDAVLAEAGQVLGNYFDGNFGTNYFWETGQTAGLARSYFYDQFGIKTQAVTNVLSHHTPLGISYTTPQYSVPYTQ